MLTKKAEKISRKQDILQNLALMLETGLSKRITTSRLAKQVGVSEAALYRHFPSKARMYESLLDFCDESIFTTINNVIQMDLNGFEKSQKIALFILSFSQKNPGITRLLTGDVFLGETERLRIRVSQLFDKIETQIKQIHRTATMTSQQKTIHSATYARLLLSVIEGRLHQFVRSGFLYSPIENWDMQWELLCKGIHNHSIEQKEVSCIE
jgi:TetR/AcrR family transcriptional regulator